jgi:hypothetical protein
MHETPDELRRLQQLLDAGADQAGPHLKSMLSADHRIDAPTLCERLSGMRLLVLATVTADGRPLTGPVDGYFLHGTFWFGSSRNSVRMRHLAARPVVSATHLPGQELSVTVHGRVELFDVLDAQRGELRQAMLDYYVPLQGPDFETWLREANGIGARIKPEKIIALSFPG